MAVSNGRETFEFDLRNTNQPYNVDVIHRNNIQYIKQMEEDFVTMIAYSPSKYLAEGMLRGIVKVTFFKCIFMKCREH